MFLIKFQEYFEKMYSCSGAFSNLGNKEILIYVSNQIWFDLKSINWI